MKKAMIILASLTMAVMISGAALAKGPGGGQGFNRGPQLTQEQIAQIDAARAKFMKDTLELRQKMAAKGMELKTLYAQPNPDQAKIKALALEMVDLRSAIAKKRIEAFSGLPVGPGLGHGYGRGMGFGGRHGRGFGPGGGRGMGPGGGYGTCWR